MTYTALMVDITKSRKYARGDRQNLQNFCLKAIDLLNGVFAGALVKAVEFSAGDEMQGLFTQADAAFLYLRLLRMLLRDKKTYAGIGHGDWTVRVNDRGTSFQDGPVYYHAREALDVCKKAKDYSVVFCTDAGVDGILSAMLNSLFSLNERLTPYQNDLKLLLEMLWPVGNEWNFEENHLHGLVDLLDYKYLLTMYSNAGSQRVFKRIREDGIMPASELKRRENDALTAGHPYRAVAALAEMTGLKRQSIEQGLKKSNVFVERNTAFAVAAFLRKELNGKE